MDNLNISPPLFGQTQPIYPHLLQLVRVTAATVVGPAGVFQPVGSSVPGPTLYVSFVEQLQTGSLLPRDREPCLVDDVNGTGLTAGYYLCRLAQQFNGLPVYEAISSAGQIITNYNNVTINFTTVVINYFASVINFFNSIVNVNNTTINVINNGQVNFGISVSVSTPPGGILSKPTQTVTGRPTWAPSNSSGTFPLLWGAFDHIEWEWDGFVRTPGGSSSTPDNSGWIPFVSVGRTPVSDSGYTAITTDRIISYIAISAPRVVTLPLANSMPPGFTLQILDESGSASPVNTISVRRVGSDIINDFSADVQVVNTPYGGGSATTDGVSEWTVRLYPGMTTVYNNGVFAFTEPIENLVDSVNLKWVTTDDPSNVGGARGNITTLNYPKTLWSQNVAYSTGSGNETSMINVTPLTTGTKYPIVRKNTADAKTTIHIQLWGSWLYVAGDVVTWRFYLGSQLGGTPILAFNNGEPVSDGGQHSWVMNALFTFRTTGASATVSADAMWSFLTTNLGGGNTLKGRGNFAGLGAVDSTTDLPIEITAQVLSTSTVTCGQSSIIQYQEAVDVGTF